MIEQVVSDKLKTSSRPNSEYVLYSYGEPVAMTNDSSTSYFGTDILGSVRSVTDKYGTVQSDYSYDAFGSPILVGIKILKEQFIDLKVKMVNIIGMDRQIKV